jgi:hypothetical protein
MRKKSSKIDIAKAKAEPLKVKTYLSARQLIKVPEEKKNLEVMVIDTINCCRICIQKFYLEEESLISVFSQRSTSEDIELAEIIQIIASVQVYLFIKSIFLRTTYLNKSASRHEIHRLQSIFFK